MNNNEEITGGRIDAFFSLPTMTTDMTPPTTNQSISNQSRDPE